MGNTINTAIFTRDIEPLAAGVRPTILVVDDDELERTLIADQLAAQGLEVNQAADGAEALERLKSQPHAVAVLDWEMPVMNGIALTEELRAAGLHDIYIIMLTARGSLIDYERGYNAGADDYLTKKTFDIELLARIRSGLNTYALRCALKQARAELKKLGR